MYVRRRPVHYPAELLPVIDLLEFHMFNGRSRDDKAVEVLILDIVKGLVELEQMFLGSIFPAVGGGLNKLDLELERRIGQAAHYLGLGDDLSRHKVQQPYFKRADILVQGAMLGDDEDMLVLENALRGQPVGNFYRHLYHSFGTI